MPFGNNIMYRIIIIFIFCLSIVGIKAGAQTYYTAMEVGFAAGGSQYFGDLNQNYGLQTIHMDYGMYVRKRINMYIALKLTANTTNIGYSDKYESNPYEKAQNLSFESAITEGALQAEFNFFGFVTGDKYHRFTPYLTGGVGGFYYNPFTYYDGKKYYLRPLGTEGQYAGYSNRQYGSGAACFPVGVGVKYWVIGGINVTIELADRLTTANYLDDVCNTYVGVSSFPKNSVASTLQDPSILINPTHPIGIAGKQRGTPSEIEQYAIGEISVSFNFTSYRCPSADRNDDQLRIH